MAVISLLFTGCSLLMTDVTLPYEQQESRGLPIFYIDPKPVSKDYYSPVTVIYKGRKYEAEGRIRGGITAYSPKKSYSLRFFDNDLFQDSELGSTGFTDRKRVLLVADFDDNSHLRNRLAQKMWEVLQKDSGSNYYSPVIQTDSAVVYTNGSYEGLYTVIDAVDEPFINRYGNGIENSIVGDGTFVTENGLEAGGSLFKGNSRQANFFVHSELYKGFDKKLGYPEIGTEGAFDNLTDFILFINNSSEAELGDPSTGFSSIASVHSYYGWWFFTAFMSAGDSLNKNAYHYQEPKGLWYYIPWDFNHSFGQNYNTKRIPNSFSSRTFVTANGIFSKLVGHPDFNSMNTFYSAILADEWSTASINSYIDEIWNQIEGAAEDDWNKWGDKYKNFSRWKDRNDWTTPQQEVEYIKYWIARQHALASGVFP